MSILVIASLVLALIPALLIAINLLLYRAPPPMDSRSRPSVSLLIPARNEAGRIEAAVRAALASEAVDLEVLVLDDHSEDGTASIVGDIAHSDPRLRCAPAPALPAGWSGKQHACHHAASLARHRIMVFVDAAVRLAPDALARMAAYLDRHPVGLVSGFPRQETGTLAEKLLIPLMHFLLMGFLPMLLMRWSCGTSFGAGCGQLMAVDADAYRRSGGHAAIRASLHDGVMLPRALRRAGVMTDIIDTTAIARCRMYRGAAEVWQGLSKNATEGMAKPIALPVWTLLLGGGQVLPFILLPVAIVGSAPSWAVAMAAFSVGLAYAGRFALAVRFRQRWTGAAVDPVGVLLLLALQWKALVDARRGRPAAWRQRAYPRS